MNGGASQYARVLADCERRILPRRIAPTTIDPLDGDDPHVTPPHDGPPAYFPHSLSAREGARVPDGASARHCPPPGGRST